MIVGCTNQIRAFIVSNTGVQNLRLEPSGLNDQHASLQIIAVTHFYICSENGKHYPALALVTTTGTAMGSSTANQYPPAQNPSEAADARVNPLDRKWRIALHVYGMNTSPYPEIGTVSTGEKSTANNLGVSQNIESWMRDISNDHVMLHLDYRPLCLTALPPVRSGKQPGSSNDFLVVGSLEGCFRVYTAYRPESGNHCKPSFELHELNSRVAGWER